MDWTKEITDALILGFDSGMSHADLAKDLTSKFNQAISRNAVLGKLHRLKLQRQRVPRPKKEKKPKMVRHYKPPVKAAPRAALRWEIEPPGIFRCTIDDLTNNRCHWPFGDNPPFLYCGASVANRGYCYFHYQKSLRAREYEQRHVQVIVRDT